MRMRPASAPIAAATAADHLVGTGSIGWAELNGRHYRVGGWGLPVSDEGSGAWLGREALRRCCGRMTAAFAWTDLLRVLFEQFQTIRTPSCAGHPRRQSRDFGSLAPRVVEHAESGDAGRDRAHAAAPPPISTHSAARLIGLGTYRLALVGGLAAFHAAVAFARDVTPYLVAPAGDALDGALQLARFDAE